MQVSHSQQEAQNFGSNFVETSHIVVAKFVMVLILVLATVERLLSNSLFYR